MILLSRLNGTELGINADLIERVESTPDTVLTLIDGTKLIVEQPATEVVSRIIDFRARVLAVAEEMAGRNVTEISGPTAPTPLHIVTDPEED